MSAPGSAMCTLCGFAGAIETDVDEAAGAATAFAFALHFMNEHPDASGGVSKHLVMVPDDRGTFGERVEGGPR